MCGVPVPFIYFYAGFASDRIGRVYTVYSTNMAKGRFGCENIASINTAIEKLKPENRVFKLYYFH